MRFFISWEHYSEEWKLLEKGYHFLELTDPFLIDIELSDYLGRLAEARGIEPRYIVPVSCQPIPSVREENEHWRPSSAESGELDPLFNEAVAFVVEKRRASITGVQRQFRIGYSRAARLIEQMEAQGIVSEPNQENGQRVILS